VRQKDVIRREQDPFIVRTDVARQLERVPQEVPDLRGFRIELLGRVCHSVPDDGLFVC
jgi:hypothetical protein